MAKGLIGRKLGMTQLFDEEGKVIPVTVVEAGPCLISQIRTKEKDGYEALQLAYGDLDDKKANKPTKGHFAKAGKGARRVVAEVRTPGVEAFEVGQELKADLFTEGEKAHVTGISKGRGFSGVVKRWGFRGGPGGHGAHFHRAPGSIGMCATPSRVLKGKRLPGRYGGTRVTVRNLPIVKVDAEKNLVLIKGSFPGARGSLLMMRTSE